MGLFSGTFLSNCHIELTNLQYADDVVLFIKNEDRSVNGVKRVLKCFELLSGLKINFHKSSLYSFKEDASKV